VSVEVAVLGALQLRVDGTLVEVPGPRRRTVLALLAMTRGGTVSQDRLIDALWRDDPPPSALNSAQSHVSRVRGHLGHRADALQRTTAGYRLKLDDLDADRAHELARRGRDLLAGDPAAAAACFEEALALWRGDALAEFAEVAPLAADGVRLTELRHALVDDLIAAQLAHLRPTQVVDAAVSAAAAAPDRESTQRRAMRALARCGRTAEALELGRTYRLRLAERTGLDPTPALAELVEAIAAGRIGPPAEGADRRHVPVPATSLLGRDAALAELRAMVTVQRCVTVTGPAGVGKTRLVIELARTLDPGDADEVFYVELAAVRDGAAVPTVVADILGVHGTGAVLDALAEALAARRSLLVVDNCEHLLAAARELSEHLLRRCPQLTVVATSREPLGTPGECVLRLDPLTLPTASEVIGGAAASAPPVALFADRARRARSSFELTADNLVAVADICRRLDGLPLAIELAASRLAGIGLTDLRDRLDARLDLVAPGRRAGRDRHATLRAAIGWSYALLDTEERLLFRHLAVFPDRFELATAEAVAAGCGLGADVIATLTRLVETSMVTATDTPDGLWYGMLDSIRAFGEERLVDAGEHDDAVTTLIAWTTGFVTRAGDGMEGPHEPAWAARVDRAWPTVRAAREHLLERGAVEAAARITVELDELMFWRDRSEPWIWAVEIAEHAALRGSAMEGATLAAAAQAAWRLGRLDRATELADRALAVAEDDRSRATALLQAGVTQMFAGDHAAAAGTMLRAAGLHRSSEALCCSTAALAAGYGGDADRAHALLDRAGRIVDDRTAPSLLAFMAYVRGEVLVMVGDDAAVAQLDRAIALGRDSGASFVIAVAGLTRAAIAARRGDLGDACARYPEVIRYWQRTGGWTQQWTTLRNVAELLALTGRDAVAAVLLLAADADPDAPEVTGDEAARLAGLHATLVERLGPDAFAHARDRAARLPRAEVVELGLTAITSTARASDP